MEISTNKQTEQQWEVQLQPFCFRNRYAIIRDSNPPKVWERHVDDVFSTLREAYLQELLDHINNVHPQTQSTKEEVNNPTLPFLDTLVHRSHDETISVKIYRKPTHTNQYLKYTPHNPTSAKQIVITALFDRAGNVVANEKDKIEEKHHILAALQQNGYPKEFIQRTVKKYNRRKEQPRERPEEEPKQTKIYTLSTLDAWESFSRPVSIIEITKCRPLVNSSTYSRL